MSLEWAQKESKVLDFSLRKVLGVLWVYGALTAL